jgi:prepilin-type N-terminal cleavage/methylation domain-containing protein
MTLKSLRNNEKGFTLIEVLLVIAIIAILAGIVILAINPNRQLAQSNNAQRSSDVTTLLNGVYQYSIDNDGTLPASLAALAADTPTEICNNGGDCEDLVDLGVLTQNQTYLTEIPADPTGATTDGTGYEIQRSANNRVTVSAPSAQNGETISVTR